MLLCCCLPCKARASTPPAEERVTLFFARANKRVTRKESTGVRALGFGVLKTRNGTKRPGPPDRGAEQTFSSSNTGDREHTDDEVRGGAVSGPYVASTNTCVASARPFRIVRCVKPGAPRDVLSFLVTLFFTRVKKRVTRSSAGGVEALALQNKKQARSRWMTSSAVEARLPLSRE